MDIDGDGVITKEDLDTIMENMDNDQQGL